MEWEHLPLPLLSMSVALHLSSLIQCSLHIVLYPHVGGAYVLAVGCILRVLLLTSPGWMEQKIPLLEHVNSFVISRFTPKI